ncbi:metallophosphoesterase [Clostridiaceae bacterium Marseille-Q3526]|nr:metallophosphoesterase [Clostridiaceae bacterium Marseille-Q3526]
MKPEKDRQQAVKLLLYLAEIAVLTAAVFLVVRFLPGGDRPWNRPPESGTLAETLPELSKPQEESGEADASRPEKETESGAEKEENREADSVPAFSQNGSGQKEGEEPEEPPYEPPYFIIASDLHYQSPLMTDFGEAFQNFVRNDDGKVVEYVDSITDAFLAEAAEKQPDALILSGDLTQNGEKVNHEELAKKLRLLESQGVPVVVIPGNHDINHPSAASFEGTEKKKADNINAEEFYSIYREFGYDEAMDRDEKSLSYIYQADERYWLMMLDSCQYDPENKIGGRIRKETLLWMEKWLERAREEQVMVIPVAHHNLLKESTLYPEDCTLENAVQVIDLLEQYGLPVYISGHLHLQRVKKHGNGGPSQAEESYGIYEIVSDSMVIPPCQYGELRWQEDGSVQYETCPVDVAGWAASQGITDENLLNFPQYSGDFLIETVQNQVYGALSAIPDDRKFHMAKLYGQINSAYCAGTAVNRRDVKENQMYFYWNRYLGTSEWYENLQAMIKDTGKDHNSLILQAGEDFPDRYKQEEIETAEKPADHTEKGEELR